MKGHLFKYDSEKDKNLLVASDVFFCADRMQGNKRHQYIMHVTDKAQKISYTRMIIEKNPPLNYTFSELDSVLMWIGKPSPGSMEVPAWSFLISSHDDVIRMKGVLTKMIFETNHMEDIEKACERDDEMWLESQVLGETDAQMDGTEDIDEYDFDSWAQISDKEETKKGSAGFGFTDEDVEEETSEVIQAHAYERNFVV
jgi:hypothetical protein